MTKQNPNNILKSDPNYSIHLRVYLQIFIWVFVVLFLPIFLKGQIIYKGIVLNKITKNAVPFASIGLMKANNGTTANEEGKFTLIANKFNNDTLVISCIGHQTTKFPVAVFPENMEFPLLESRITLREIIVGKRYENSIWLNDYSNCGTTSFTASGTTIMLAQHFRSNSPNSLLKEINLCKLNGPSFFRLRIFDMDSISHKPSIDLCDTIIEVRAGNKHININLEQYKIIIPSLDFYIAIEWLYIPYNESKVKSKLGGQKIIQSQFAPHLLIKYKKNKTLDSKDFLDLWQLDYRGKWNRMPGNMRMLISAKLQY